MARKISSTAKVSFNYGANVRKGGKEGGKVSKGPANKEQARRYASGK